MFGVFLFVTYYLETTLKFTPINTGLSFLPMIGMLVLFAQLGTNVFVPRFGPKILVPVGMGLGVIAMLILNQLKVDSTYAANVLPALMVMGAAMGTIMPASMQTATLGVDRQFAGVASAMTNTSQQVGGSIGTALLNTLAATAATDYVASHVPPHTVTRPGSLSRRCCSVDAVTGRRWPHRRHQPSSPRSPRTSRSSRARSGLTASRRDRARAVKRLRSTSGGGGEAVRDWGVLG
jgi:hypothetical protein